MKCSVLEVADIIGKKWTLVVIQEIFLNGEKGFNYIFKRMGKISPKVLSKRLKELEEGGLVKKSILANKIPVRTLYKLTKKGEDLQKIINSLKDWTAKYSKSYKNCKDSQCSECPLY